jgi:hypothetical protein
MSFNSSRRTFLTATAGAAALSQAVQAQPPAPLLPTVRFKDKDVTRLIIGTNPFMGYSHFNSMLDKFMREYMTEEKRAEILMQAEREGINTWQLHYQEPTIKTLKTIRAAGSKLNTFLLSDFEVQKNFGMIPDLAKMGFIGMAHHGNRTDEAFREGKMDRVKEFLARVKDTGMMAGVSSHNPEALTWIEEKGWDLDYYMTCMYRVSRSKEETRKFLGEAPLGEPFLENDPVRMTAFVRATKRPCLAFKVLGAGRVGATRENIEAAFKFAFANIKPTDAVIVGMCPKFKDEVKENAELVRQIAGRPIPT